MDPQNATPLSKLVIYWLLSSYSFHTFTDTLKPKCFSQAFSRAQKRIIIIIIRIRRRRRRRRSTSTSTSISRREESKKKKSRNQFPKVKNQFHIYFSISYLFKSLTFFHAFGRFFWKKSENMNITFELNKNYFDIDNLFNFKNYILKKAHLKREKLNNILWLINKSKWLQLTFYRPSDICL